MYSIEILYQIINKRISHMDLTLVRRFSCTRPNIEYVRAYVRKKWSLQSQVDIIALAKGCLSFIFSCEEDKRDILCCSPWVLGKHTLVL